MCSHIWKTCNYFKCQIDIFWEFALLFIPISHPCLWGAFQKYAVDGTWITGRKIMLALRMNFHGSCLEGIPVQPVVWKGVDIELNVKFCYFGGTPPWSIGGGVEGISIQAPGLECDLPAAKFKVFPKLQQVKLHPIMWKERYSERVSRVPWPAETCMGNEGGVSEKFGENRVYGVSLKDIIVRNCSLLVVQDVVG